MSRTHALESLVIAGFVRGLSTRDVEAALAEALGPEATLSKSTVSRACEALKEEFGRWQQRDLSGLGLDYPFTDASCFKMHPGSPRAEPLLCAWGITTGGKKALVGLGEGAAESYEAWLDFFRDLKAWELRAPLLGISDGAPGLLRAFEEAFQPPNECGIIESSTILAVWER